MRRREVDGERESGGGRLRAVSGGLILIAAVALCGWLLDRLGGIEPHPTEIHDIYGDDAGNRLALIVAGPRGRWPQVVLSRYPFEVDPRRSIVRLENGGRRVIPSGIDTVLIHEGGRLELLPRPLPAAFFRELASRPPREGERLDAWFRGESVTSALREADPRVRELWR
jgi:hypothetical protein